jgi:hypothetical protein
VEVVLRTSTPEGIEVVLPALVYAKIVEEHRAVADLGLIDRPFAGPTTGGPIRGQAASGFSGRKGRYAYWRS